MEAIRSSGFWGTTKPYCSFCGWNQLAAKELARASLKGAPKNLLFFAAFFGFFGYLYKSEVVIFPFLFLSVFVVGDAIASWRKLKLLEASHPAVAYANPLTSVIVGKKALNQVPVSGHHHLWSLSKPRRVRFKPVARIFAVILPISWIFIAFFGYQIVRDQIEESRSLPTLGKLVPLLLFALIWTFVGITTIKSARKDRKLFAEGDLAIATVTHQKLSGGKHRHSGIRYEFKDHAGRLVEGKGTDDSWELYEDMEVPVFYDPENPGKNVAICSALCEIRTD
jgi:hypothetical protein